MLPPEPPEPEPEPPLEPGPPVESIETFDAFDDTDQRRLPSLATDKSMLLLGPLDKSKLPSAA